MRGGRITRLMLLQSGLVALGLSVAAPELQAQAHEVRQGPYVLRSSAVATQHFDAATARNHGIEPAPNRAVLNVTVLQERGGVPHNARGEVSATASDLAGRKRAITMRPVSGNDRVSYIGAFEFLPREVLRMEIVATPEGSGRSLTLSYEERMWAPERVMLRRSAGASGSLPSLVRQALRLAMS